MMNNLYGQSLWHETYSMYEAVIFDFGDPYDVFWALLWITAMNLYVDWYFLCWCFYALKPLKKLKKAKPCKNIWK